MKILKIVFALSLIVSFSNFSKAQEKADLQVVNIQRPDWNDSTIITVEVKNTGKAVSEPAILKIWDLDISVKEAKKIGVKKSDIWMFEENSTYSEDGSSDYDENWEKNVEIPALQSNETHTVTIYLQHWVYDPNCEIGAFIDSGDAVKESNEENNKLYFYEGG